MIYLLIVDLWEELNWRKDVGVLYDIAASYSRHGPFYAEVFRCPCRSSLCALHCCIYLVLFSFYYHPRACWHLVGTYLFPSFLLLSTWFISLSVRLTLIYDLIVVFRVLFRITRVIMHAYIYIWSSFCFMLGFVFEVIFWLVMVETWESWVAERNWLWSWYSLFS